MTSGCAVSLLVFAVDLAPIAVVTPIVFLHPLVALILTHIFPSAAGTGYTTRRHGNIVRGFRRDSGYTWERAAMSPRSREELAELALTEEEYRRIVDVLDREPNDLELGIFSALWSEHCGYKHSKPLLRLLPSSGKRGTAGGGFGERRGGGYWRWAGGGVQD